MGEYPTQLTFTQDGCRTNSPEYLVQANYTWVFSEFADSTTNYTNTEYLYSAAIAVPYTQSAVDALTRACPSQTFAVNQSTDVLGCLYCAVGYDIFYPLSNETFVLGASENVTCTEADRPTDIEESIFVLVNDMQAPGTTVTGKNRIWDSLGIFYSHHANSWNLSSMRHQHW